MQSFPFSVQKCQKRVCMAAGCIGGNRLSRFRKSRFKIVIWSAGRRLISQPHGPMGSWSSMGVSWSNGCSICLKSCYGTGLHLQNLTDFSSCSQDLTEGPACGIAFAEELGVMVSATALGSGVSSWLPWKNDIICAINAFLI